MSNNRLPQAEINQMVSMTDMNESGAIDYGEFLAATVHASKFAKEEHLQRAFAEFDSDGSGETSFMAPYLRVSICAYIRESSWTASYVHS